METLPPGVTEDAVTDVDRLLDAHQDHFDEDGSTLEMAFQNSTGIVLQVTRINDTSARLITLKYSGERLSYYFADPVYAVYNGTDRTVAYAHGDVPLAGDAALIDIFITGLGTTWLEAVEWKPAGVRTEDGEQRLVLRGSSLNETLARRNGTLLPPLADGEPPIPEVEAEMVVTGEGVIRDASLAATSEVNGTNKTVRFVLSATPYTPDSLSEPGWLSDAPRVELDAVADDRLLALNHTGGPPIQSGRELNVTADGKQVGTVTLPSAVEPGETVYVYRTSDGSLEVSVGDRPTVPDDAKAFAGRVLVTGSQGQVTFRAGTEIGEE